MKLSGGPSSGESRCEAPSEWGRGLGKGCPLPRKGCPLPRDGVRGITPGKLLKFETQFGAIWCVLARN